MGNAAWVCFDCRAAVRRSIAFAGEVPCSACGRPCAYLGYKIPVPPKSKLREWAALREQLAHGRMQQQLDAEAFAVRHRHDLEQEIVRLETLPANEGRARKIRSLRKRLDEANTQ